VNFFLRQSIVGLLRQAAETQPSLRVRALLAAEALDRTLTVPWLHAAFSLFEEAALLSRDACYVSGAYWTTQALAEVSRWEARGAFVGLPGAGGPQDDRVGPPGSADRPEDAEAVAETAAEAAGGLVELFERIRRGASLEEALALFPALGDECSPGDDRS